jgi:co-chaperonin GroES (HSP10)
MNIELINGNVLIHNTNKDDYAPATGAGILTKVESKWNNFVQGEIAWIAPTFWNGERWEETNLKVGDKIYYAKTVTVPARDEIRINEEDYVVKKISDIVGVIKQ